MTRASVCRLVLFLGALSSSTACFSYRTVSSSALQPGMDVTTELTGRGLERLQRGPEASAIALRGIAIRGSVERVDGDSLLLLVPTTVVRGDFLAQTMSQRVQLAHSEVNSAQVRQLDRGRTALVAVGVAVLSYIVVSRLQEGAGARGGVPLPGGPPESRVPLSVRWSIR